MRPMRHLFALLIGLLALGPAAADELVGKYQAHGTYPTGKSYDGAVQIEQLGRVHVVLWKLADGQAYKGIGLRQGDVLGAAYGPPGTRFGVAVYKIDGGKLTGLWVDSRDLKSELGKETLEGSPDLNGAYKITLGENRDGLTNYNGQVQIKHSGDNYVVIWPTKPPAVGIGVRVKDVLVVAYGSDMQKLPGVVAYQSTGSDTLSGIWSQVGVKNNGAGNFSLSTPSKVGREDLTRAP